MSEQSGAGEKFLFLLFGAVIGAATALLLAPRSGEETRKIIMTKARQGADTVTSQGKAFVEKTSEYMDRGKDVVQHQRDSLNAALEAGKKAYREEKEKA
ncbi:MAG: YtxH domain-containing protein [Acidobacteria bacterium]|nr:YtxH domain-containing protein [Acidobacteriota bacterium]